MKVREVMTKNACFCGPESSLEEACFLMRKHNCGFLPVVGDGGNVIGVVTDRDICIALGTRNKLAGDISVCEVASAKVHSCLPEDEIHVALYTMRHGHVRRLPVVDADGRLVGVLSIDDILMHAKATSSGQIADVSTEEIVRTLRAINHRDLPLVANRHRAAA